MQRSERSPGEGIDYPLQYFWASLVAQMVKNPPDKLVLGSIPGLGRFLGGEHGNPLQYSLLGAYLWTEEPGELQSMGSQKLDTTE